jgi:hypothetical protein
MTPTPGSGEAAVCSKVYRYNEGLILRFVLAGLTVLEPWRWVEYQNIHRKEMNMDLWKVGRI